MRNGLLLLWLLLSLPVLADDPSEVARRFYQWNANFERRQQSGQMSLSEALPEQRAALTSELYERVLRWLDTASRVDGAEEDFQPFTGYPVALSRSKITISPAAIKGSTAVCRVTLDDGVPHALEVQFQQNQGRWRIVDFRYEDGRTFMTFSN